MEKKGTTKKKITNSVMKMTQSKGDEKRCGGIDWLVDWKTRNKKELGKTR